jgi:cytochrome c oxidase cbb3-type subunit 3
MKKIFILLFGIFFLIPGTVLAGLNHLLFQESTLIYSAFFLVIALLGLVILILIKTINLLVKTIYKTQGYTSAEIQAEFSPVKKIRNPSHFWEKALSLKPLSEEKSLLREDEYDGIHELNNPIPGWFQVLFISTIAFAAAYLLIYHVFKWAPLQDEEYKMEMAKAESDKKLYLSKLPSQIDEKSVKLTTDAGTLKAGNTVFGLYCVACHGDKGQGIVGPNLTDDYWIHGNKIGEVFKTVKYGVNAKGMPSWEKQLSAQQISDVSNYVESLHGTNPPGAKPPQGDKMTY